MNDNRDEISADPMIRELAEREANYLALHANAQRRVTRLKRPLDILLLIALATFWIVVAIQVRSRPFAVVLVLALGAMMSAACLKVREAIGRRTGAGPSLIVGLDRASAREVITAAEKGTPPSNETAALADDHVEHLRAARWTFLKGFAVILLIEMATLWREGLPPVMTCVVLLATAPLAFFVAYMFLRYRRLSQQHRAARAR